MKVTNIEHYYSGQQYSRISRFIHIKCTIIVLFTHALPCLDIVLHKSVHLVWIWTGNTALLVFYLGCHHPICHVCVMPMGMLTS